MKKKYITILITLVIITSIFIIQKNKTKETTSIEENTEKNEVILEEYIETQEDGTLKNKSEKLKEEKQIDKVKIYNIRITGQNKETTMLIDIKNTTNLIQEEKQITIIMRDKEGKVLGELGLNIPQIEKNGARTIEVKLEEKYINIYDIEVIDEKLNLE